MAHDILGILYFYRSTIGKVVKDTISSEVNILWNKPHQSICGIGYPDPFFDDWHCNNCKFIALTPATMGAYARSGLGSYVTALINDVNIPLKPESQKKIFCIHLLEHSTHPELCIRELYQCLEAEGELIIIVPNRHGKWARHDDNPFGSGRPFTRNQIKKLLETAGFIITQHTSNLFIAPKASRLSIYNSNIIENLGRFFLPRYGGIHIIHAIKRLYVPHPTQKIASHYTLNELPDFIPNNNIVGKSSIK